MKLIVGLGNIGNEYKNTRHNIGFMVLDELAKEWSINNWKKERSAEVAEYRFNGEKILLARPTTYMNLSGNAVGQLANFYNIVPPNIAVIQDDLDLPCGKLRIRKQGSAGGHNGIKSILEHLGTNVFPRFKIGIGHPEHLEQKVINHVLTKFSGEEKKFIDEAIKKCSNAIICWLENDLDLAMNRFNN